MKLSTNLESEDVIAWIQLKILGKMIQDWLKVNLRALNMNGISQNLTYLKKMLTMYMLSQNHQIH